jgi:hypothetical protein
MQAARSALFAAFFVASHSIFTASPTGAATGMVAINQDNAVAGNVTPGDSGGKP